MCKSLQKDSHDPLNYLVFGFFVLKYSLTVSHNLQEKFEWIEEPVDKKIKQGSLDEVTFSAKLSHKGKKAKWYMRNQVRSAAKNFVPFI
mgnify:CR=1 FL=1